MAVCRGLLKMYTLSEFYKSIFNPQLATAIYTVWQKLSLEECKEELVTFSREIRLAE
jgi:hypothetical protein